MCIRDRLEGLAFIAGVDRILDMARTAPVSYTHLARTKLARLLATKGITHEIQIPDISTKEKAQQAIGLNMEQIKACLLYTSRCV